MSVQQQTATTKSKNEELVLAQMCKDFTLDLTMEQVYAQVDKEYSMDKLIAELENELEAEKKA